MNDEHAETLRKLKEATCEAHEAIKEAREERRKLEGLKKEIQLMVMEATKKAIEVEIKDSSEIVMTYQKTLEEEIQKRFDDLANGPMQELETLLRNLHKVHATVPLSRITMNPLPENPLFPKRG